MHRLAGAATGVLLAGPFTLAFFSGGFFDQPRLVAGVVACVLVGVAALSSRVPFPRALPGRLALGSLAALCGLTALSVEWAPSAGDVVDDTGRLLLYLAALTAGLALLRERRARAVLEPALAGGALVVILYGLSERFLPGIVELGRSTTAAGRLEQPLTYWNAMGGMAGLGIVLSARLAGDPGRPPGLRAAAGAAAVPLGLGVFMSFSRGALLAAGLGLLRPVRARAGAAPAGSRLHHGEPRRRARLSRCRRSPGHTDPRGRGARRTGRRVAGGRAGARGR